MNTTEQIVESYYRICKECFTIPDVKVQGGYSRQFDLLAYCLRNDEQYHVEVQVSHSRRFALTTEQMFARFDTKFLGKPRKKDSNKRPRKGDYLSEIQDTYRWYGFKLAQVKRVWVCWNLPDDETFLEQLDGYNKREEVRDNPVEVLTFQDFIIPELMKHVRTAHYEDISLRTLSLLRQCKIQGNIAREKKSQGKLLSE